MTAKIICWFSDQSRPGGRWCPFVYPANYFRYQGQAIWRSWRAVVVSCRGLFSRDNGHHRKCAAFGHKRSIECWDRDAISCNILAVWLLPVSMAHPLFFNYRGVCTKKPPRPKIPHAPLCVHVTHFPAPKQTGLSMRGTGHLFQLLLFSQHHFRFWSWGWPDNIVYIVLCPCVRLCFSEIRPACSVCTRERGCICVCVWFYLSVCMRARARVWWYLYFCASWMCTDTHCS